MKRLLLLFSFVFFSLSISAQVYWPYSGQKYPTCSTMTTPTSGYKNCDKVAVGGDWDVASSWNPSGVPISGQVVCIPKNVTITVQHSQYNGSALLQIFICGTLSFAPSGTLDLARFSFVQIYDGGKIDGDNNNSEQIKIDGVIKWSAKDGDVLGPRFISNNGVGNGVLSVMFESIKVNQTNPYQIGLEWNTLWESKSNYFIVERSADQKTWSAIGTVKSVGNSSLKTSYSFVDKNPLSGTSFYRLKQVDIDGAAAYSDIVKVINNQSAKTVSIYPNPVSGIANLYSKTNFKSGQQLFLIDAKGTKVKAFTASSNTNIMQVDLTTMKSGLYLLQIVDNGSVIESLPLIKQ